MEEERSGPGQPGPFLLPKIRFSVRPNLAIMRSKSCPSRQYSIPVPSQSPHTTTGTPKALKREPPPEGVYLSGAVKNLAASYFPARRCAVSSARKSLTAEFGMGSGVPSTPWLPKAWDGALSRGSGALQGFPPPGHPSNSLLVEPLRVSTLRAGVSQKSKFFAHFRAGGAVRSPGKYN